MHFKSHSAFQDGKGALKPVTAMVSLHHKLLCLAAFPPAASNAPGRPQLAGFTVCLNQNDSGPSAH